MSDQPQPTKTFQQTLAEQWSWFSSQASLTLSTTPIPGMLVNLKARWHQYKTIVFLVTAVIGLLFIISIGLNLGQNLALTSKTPVVTPEPLPNVSPTVAPPVVTSFDQIYTNLNAFSSLLPDPAPPAVDDGITLIQPRQ